LSVDVAEALVFGKPMNYLSNTPRVAVSLQFAFVGGPINPMSGSRRSLGGI
jgi:hypothetical protein